MVVEPMVSSEVDPLETMPVTTAAVEIATGPPAPPAPPAPAAPELCSMLGLLCCLTWEETYRRPSSASTSCTRALLNVRITLLLNMGGDLQRTQ
jgi:hypothetical protein